jgi:chondroitin AC lyase
MMSIRLLMVATALLLAAAAAPADADKDMQTLRQRIIDELTSVPARKPSAKADTLPADPDDSIAKHLAMIKPDGSFSDLDYTDTRVNDAWGPAVALTRIKQFAVAYARPNGKYTNDPKLKDAMLRGIRFWDENDFRSKNWFWNEIGVPGLLGRTCLIVWADVPADEKPRALAIVARAKLQGTSP